MNSIKKFKVAIAQIAVDNGVDDNSIEKNRNRLVGSYKLGNEQGCDIVLAPELCVSGYAIGDLMNRKDVQQISIEAEQLLLDQIKDSQSNNNTALIFGNFSTIKQLNKMSSSTTCENFESLNALQLNDNFLSNYARIFQPGEVRGEVAYAFKKYLPNWSVFDEVRWFASGKNITEPVDINGVMVGVCVCRDIWIESTTRELVKNGAQIIVVPNASPYANGRHGERIKVVGAYAKKYNIPIVYVNMHSASDEIIFDGGAFAVDNTGQVLIEMKRFQDDFQIVEVDLSSKPVIPDETMANEEVDISSKNVDKKFVIDEGYSACVMGLKEYINTISDSKAGVVIGLSGGIDSALVATLAVDAFGSERVHGVLMPSKHTSNESTILAENLAKNLGISYETISIEQLHDCASQVFELEDKESVVSENVQSRLRGLILMMLSNSRGWLPLATGNKSEISVGYYTLYGDSVGAFAPIKDVYKTQVFELCKYRNNSTDYKIMNPIPQQIIDRPPTAELREGQYDSDSLPVYEVLDAILIAYIDHEKSIDEIAKMGYLKTEVERIVKLVNSMEFKRKQSPIGTRLTRHNFGSGRRIPISTRS